MPVHLLKLCVGAGSIAELEAHIAGRLALARAAKLPCEQVHTTRMLPKRAAEIVGAGSLFWVIKGHIAARQPVLDIRPFTDSDGIGRCHLVLEPVVVPVLPRPCRPFQGWRYLADDVKPVDLAGLAGAGDMPEHLRFALRELCLI